MCNRFCDKCLGDNYSYPARDYRKDTFICPRCKGLNKPNKRCVAQPAAAAAG